jgi:glycosyltransferase 2 family protein
MNPIIKNILRLGVALGLLYWLVVSDRLDVGRFLALQFSLPLLCVFVGQLAMMIITLLRWQILLRPHGIYLKFFETIHLGFMGYFANIFVPGSLGIEAIRFYHLSKCENLSSRKSLILSSIIMDRSAGLLGLMLIAPISGGLLLFMNGGQKNLEYLLWFSVLLLLVSVTGLALICSRRGFQKLPFLKRINAVANFASAMQSYRNHFSTLAVSLLLSILGHVCVIFAAYFSFMTFGSLVGPLVVSCVMPFVILSRIIPLTPLGLGVSDTVGSEIFSLFDAVQGAEVVMLMRAAVILLSSFGVFFYFKKFKPDLVSFQEETNGKEK